ncbi:hypothetical protein [Pseudaestuariivita atlantica]|nr:hypothetical protein [Pseudaestuariivita atlantica]
MSGEIVCSLSLPDDIDGTMDWTGTFEGLKAVAYAGAMTLVSFVYLASVIASGLAAIDARP